MKEKTLVFAVCLLLLASMMLPVAVQSRGGQGAERIMVKTSVELTPAVVQQLSAFAISVNFIFEEIDALAMSVTKANLAKLKQLDLVEWVEIDREVRVLGDHSGGLYTWNLDMINAEIAHDKGYGGDGVYVAVLDTGLVPHWRNYFNEESIATEYATAFLSAMGTQVPGNAWDKDTDSHGTHVTSTILGYWLYGTSITGVAPGATVIPVKVIGNGGFGWTSCVVAGIMYIADLKESEEITEPIVISMSIGSPVHSLIEEAAIDYAIGLDIPVVASAGNRGEDGMGYPAALPQVISVGACGWTMEWTVPGWWLLEVPEDPDDLIDQVYITSWSSRELWGQELDVVAPGSWVVGPYMPYGVAHPPQWAPAVPGEYYFVGGTSMATPHVSGIVVLMLQADVESNSQQTLAVADIESILKSTALEIPAPSSAWIVDPFTGEPVEVSWSADATGAGLVQAHAAIETIPTP